MTLEAFALFCVTEAVLCLTPGPAVLFVLSLAVSRGSAAGLSGAVGIVAGNTMYFAISATTIGALLLASYELFFLVKWVGAAYLIWMGLHSLLRASHAVPADDAVGAAPPPPRHAVAFTQGFLTQAANPKALVFFSAILPQFVDPAGSIAMQVLILGIASQVIEIVVLAMYVVIADRMRSGAAQSRLTVPLQRLGGVLLMTAGARLATLAR